MCLFLYGLYFLHLQAHSFSSPLFGGTLQTEEGEEMTKLPRVNVVFPKDTHKIIKRLADQSGKSKSAIVGILVEIGLTLRRPERNGK